MKNSTAKATVIKIGNLIQLTGAEYQRKDRNKGFWHIQRNRKSLFLCEV